MVSVFSLVRRSPTFSHLSVSCLASILLTTCLSSKAVAGAPGPNLLPAGSFSNTLPTYVPWAGVDAQNNIHGINGKQLMVNDSGGIVRGPFGPSVAVGDMNGDGKNDLILADSYGFFWYFPNTGTPQVPAFTQGEVIPIWLGDEATEQAHDEGLDNIVPRIQLLDFNGQKKLDVVAGTYSGALFRIPNTGSSGQPDFRPTLVRPPLLINTHKQGKLWCNYLAPFLTTAFSGNNVFDLVAGEGTYSANSIWLLHNTDTSDHPIFNEDHLQRIIPGMGMEQLTPSVLDWNNDGKPDIITGDRNGYISLFLNNSTDPSNPTFAPGVHIKIGGQEKMGGSITATVCDLSNNHLPNLLIGKDDGTLLYAINSGTPGNPQFNTPATPLKGVLPQDYHYTSLTQWYKTGAWGVPYEMLGATNPQLEKGFTFPDGVNVKYALKFWVWPYKNQWFQRYYMPEENTWNEHIIHSEQGFTLKMNTKYILHFWVLVPGNSVSNFRYNIWDSPYPGQKWCPPGLEGDISGSSTWSEVTRNFEIRNDPDPTVKQYGYNFQFKFRGQSTFYIADLQIQQDND